MLKNAEKFIVNLLLFWVFVSTMPGIASPNGSFGYFFAGGLFGLSMLILPEILRFFKFPKNAWGKLLIGTAMTFGLLLLISSMTPDILTISTGYIGNFDFIWFTPPTFLSLPSELSVIGFVSLLLNVCSIILHFLNKGRI